MGAKEDREGGVNKEKKRSEGMDKGKRMESTGLKCRKMREEFAGLKKRGGNRMPD